jgi:hypothetical protein
MGATRAKGWQPVAVRRTGGHFNHDATLRWELCMRAADAAEKTSREKPELLQRHKPELLGLMTETTKKEVRWHLTVIVVRLRLTASERRHTAEILQDIRKTSVPS